MSRVQLAQYFKQEAFQAIGINPERMGTPISQQTATGVTQAVSASYAQTEVYFTNHSDNLMPRVHQMRTDLAQYYYSTNPSVRLSYISSEAEKVNFQINGTDLLLRDFNVFCTTRTNHRAILDQLKQLALTNNTSGASIFDLGSIIKSDSISEVTDILKESEQKANAARQEQTQAQQQMQQQQIAAKQEEEKMKLQFQQEENDKERQKDITVAEIRAAGYGAQADVNENKISDFQDAMGDIRKRDEYREQMNFKREEAANDNANTQAKLNIDKEKLATQRDIANKNLEIARENKNKYDVQSDKKKKDKGKK